DSHSLVDLLPSGIVPHDFMPASGMNGALEIRSSENYSDGSIPTSGYWSNGDNHFTRIWPNHDFTIAVWFKPKVLNKEHAIMGVWQESNNQRNWVIRLTSSNNFGIRLANGSTTGAPSELTGPAQFANDIVSDRWYMILVERIQSSN